MVDLGLTEEDFHTRWHLTGRKNALLKELADSLGDVEMYTIARELRQVMKELYTLPEKETEKTGEVIVTKWYDRIGNSIEMLGFETDSESNVRRKWIKGKVIKGYRYMDGVITMKADADGRAVWYASKSDCYRKAEDSLGDLIIFSENG